MRSHPLNSTVRNTIMLCVLVALCEGIDRQAVGVAAARIAAELNPTRDDEMAFTLMLARTAQCHQGNEVALRAPVRMSASSANAP